MFYWPLSIEVPLHIVCTSQLKQKKQQSHFVFHNRNRLHLKAFSEWVTRKNEKTRTKQNWEGKKGSCIIRIYMVENHEMSTKFCLFLRQKCVCQQIRMLKFFRPVNDCQRDVIFFYANSNVTINHSTNFAKLKYQEPHQMFQMLNFKLKLNCLKWML